MKRRRSTQIFLSVAALLCMLGASGDQARFNDLGHKMICMCSCNQILLECNHVGCTMSGKMRGQLTAAITRESSDSLVQQSFVQEYGLTVLAAPPNTGFGRVAWITPFLVFFTGLLAVVLVVRNWRLRAPQVMASEKSSLSAKQLLEYREKARKETDL